jgi:hypothetical protein
MLPICKLNNQDHHHGSDDDRLLVETGQPKKSTMYFHYAVFFFPPIWDWSRGQNSYKTGNLGNIYTSTFSLNCPFFLPKHHDELLLIVH